jgi:cytidine deaminase
MSRTLKPEIVIGLAGPVGTDLRGLGTAIAEKLRSFGYRSDIIRASNLIQTYCDSKLREKISTAKHGERIRLLMAAGDHLRKQANSGDALVPLLITAIRRSRSKYNENINISSEVKNNEDDIGVFKSNTPANNVCYIID